MTGKFQCAKINLSRMLIVNSSALRLVAVKWLTDIEGRATGQGSPVQVCSFGRTDLHLRRLPPDVQRCGQNRPQREAEEQVHSHRDGLPPTERVRSSHPLHPVSLRGSVLGLSEQQG